jgi:hypothetical protein
MDSTRTKLSKAQILPPEACRLLTEAAQTGAIDSNARRLAIDAATERIKMLYPQFFKDSDESLD